MLKKYLNANDRLHCAHLMLCAGGAEKLLSSIEMGKEERTALKYVLTYSKKWWSAISARLDQKEKERLNNMFQDCKPMMVPKFQKNRQLPVSDETIYDMFEFFAEACCTQCDLEEEYFLQCPLFNINQNLNVQISKAPDEKYCPYRYFEEKEEENEN